MDVAEAREAMSEGLPHGVYVSGYTYSTKEGECIPDGSEVVKVFVEELLPSS